MTSPDGRITTQSSPTLRRGFFYARLFQCPMQLYPFPVLKVFRLFSYYLLLLPILLSAYNTYPLDSIYGQTIDEKGRPIPFVSLILPNSQIPVLSDEDGEFGASLPVLLTDSIQVQRIGYYSQSISIVDLLRNRNITLRTRSVSLPTVTVQATEPTESHTVVPALIRFQKSNTSGITAHRTVLQRIPGISIRSYGGPAGISTLSMDGGPSSHTRILLDDIDISSAQNGEADLSQLPLPILKTMQYTPFTLDQNGGGGLDGTLKLGSTDYGNHLSFSGGSFGHRSLDLNLNHHFQKFWTSLKLGTRRESGNYPVSWNGHTHKRLNNSLEQNFTSMHLLGLVRPDVFLQSSLMVSRQSRGVAGLLWSPDTLSHRNDQLLLAGTTLGHVHASGSTRLQMTWRNSSEHYCNPFLNIDSDHEVHTFQVHLKDNHRLSPTFRLLSEFNLVADHIQSSITSKHRRFSRHLSFIPVIQPVAWLSLIPTISLHDSPGLYQHTTTDFQLLIRPDWRILQTLSYSRGDIFRYPSFNDLYWIPGGNPNLKPETASVQTAQIQLDFSALGKLLIQWQQKESRNLIQWMPVHSYWQPGNIQQSIRISRKIIWQGNWIKAHLTWFAHFSLINARDILRQKPLRYAPDRTAAAGFTWSPALGEFSLQYNAVSDRISMYDYPVDTILKATELWFASLAHTWNLNRRSLTLVLAVDNLTDLSYETIRGYPEPGRSFRLSMTIQH